MNPVRRLLLTFKATRQLGLEQTSLNALYRFGLWSGHYRRSTPGPSTSAGRPTASIQVFPSLVLALDALYPISPDERRMLLAQAGEICTGQVRLFGGNPVPLNLEPGGPLVHWTEYEKGQAKLDTQEDIKFIWEPARFSWAYPLGRAYSVSLNEDYAHFFWQKLEAFLKANPPYLGPNWTSGQEVALRLMAFVFAAAAFSASPHSTPQRMQQLSESVAWHARRIPLTLIYARSQNNNHLLSEAAGLYTAGLALPGDLQAAGWSDLGWKWFNRGLQTQIAVDGTYAQHSTNYHRLVLQLALWAAALGQLPGGQAYPDATLACLNAAANWLEQRVDPLAGRVTNLGANDGAYIMPLSPAPFQDFRPVADSAMKLWGIEARESGIVRRYNGSDLRLSTLESRKSEIRVFLRCIHFTSRPSHADQLHLDLFWRGLPVALDAGTYLYNAPPPWENVLATTAVHNTVLVDNQEQMVRAGRFLWLDWAQGWVESREEDTNGSIRRLVASHNGYRRLGVIHRRNVAISGTGCVTVVDELLPVKPSGVGSLHHARLHWLLPDWPWSLQGSELDLISPQGKVQIELNGCNTVTIARAGTILVGPGPVSPFTGWVSPTYAQKEPALALIALATGPLPVKLSTVWQFL